MKRLKVALLGLRGLGVQFLAAIIGDDQFELVAVADTDPQTLRRCADSTRDRVDSTSCAYYEDYRSLIVEQSRSGLELLFVALEPFESAAFVELAGELGITVFHKSPFARTVTQGRRLLERFEASGSSLLVSRWWSFVPVLGRLGKLDALVGLVYVASVGVACASGASGWRGDSRRSGGGVLLNGAYEQVDMLVCLLGLPESVYAQCGLGISPGGPKGYDTEDAVTVVFQFKGNRMASLTAWRGDARSASQVTLVGTEGRIEIGLDWLTIARRDSGVGESYPMGKEGWIAFQISEIGAGLRAGIRCLPSTAIQHINTLAVVEAAYLSAQTGSPESPMRFVDPRS